MKNIIISVLFCLPFISNAQQNTGIAFTELNSWEQILQKAKAENKLIFVDLYTTWCGPCKKMDRETYTDRTVGDFVNDNFISAKIQMDSTANDSPAIRISYQLAKQVEDKYQIESFPSLLFLSANGELLERDLGFKDKGEFLDLAKKAANPNTNYLGLIQSFHKGELDKTQLLALALRTKQNREYKLAHDIARSYKKKFIDGMPAEQILSGELATVITEFTELFSWNDLVAKYMFAYPQESDKKMKVWNGFSNLFMVILIKRDYVDTKLWPNGKMMVEKPNWIEMERNIAAMFDTLIADRVITDSKIRWYTEKKDWPQVAKNEIAKIEKKGIDTTMMGAIGINALVFNIIFKHCTNRKELEKGIEYMEVLLKRDPDNYHKIDTYANILYKAGYKEKAIENERRAISIAEKQLDHEYIIMYKEILEKIIKSQPTWSG